MKKTIAMMVAAMAAAIVVAVFFVFKNHKIDRRNDIGYRAELAGLVESQRSAAGEAARLRRELVGVDFEALAARREKAGDEEKKSIDGLFAKRARAERMEKEVVRLQNEARQRVAARRQKEAAEMGNF
jgi:hypothetical protein